MNRAQRRAKKVDNSDPTYTLKNSDIIKIKQDATKRGVDVAFTLMLAIPTMVIHDKYSLIMKKEVEGKSREERFVALCLDLYDSYSKGYVTFDDLKKCLWDEAGIRLE